MKTKIAPLVIFLLLFQMANIATVAQETKVDTSIEKSLEENERDFYTFSDITIVKDIPSLFQYLENFISWAHWRYWVSIIILGITWLAVIILTGQTNRLLSTENIEKLKQRENIFYIGSWLFYSFIVAVFFTFAHEHLISFFEESSLFSLPVGQHWIHWVLWSCLVLLALGAIVDTLYNLIVFKLVGILVILDHLIQGAISIVAVFFLTTLVTYFIIGIGIIVGGIIVGIIAISILISLLKGAAKSIDSIGTSDIPYDEQVKRLNENQKQIDEKYRKEKQRREKFNNEH